MRNLIAKSWRPEPRTDIPRESRPFEMVLFAVVLLAAALVMQALVASAHAEGVRKPVDSVRKSAEAPNREPTLGLKPGEEVVLGQCLRFMVRGFTDRSGVLDHFDWVNLKVQNECTNVRRHLLIELVLLDAYGNPYGTPIWVLERGERLWPGRAKIGNFPVPDPDNLTPVRWAVRLVKVERPRSRRNTGAAQPAPAPVRQVAPRPEPRPTLQAAARRGPTLRKAAPGGSWWK